MGLLLLAIRSLYNWGTIRLGPPEDPEEKELLFVMFSTKTRFTNWILQAVRKTHTMIQFEEKKTDKQDLTFPQTGSITPKSNKQNITQYFELILYFTCNNN